MGRQKILEYLIVFCLYITTQSLRPSVVLLKFNSKTAEIKKSSDNNNVP